MSHSRFTFHRLWAIVLKEFIQMRRDRVTFGMMIGIPLIQLMLFGFAINSDPRHLPTAVRCADAGPFARTLVAALRQSDYFAVVREAEREARRDFFGPRVLPFWRWQEERAKALLRLAPRLPWPPERGELLRLLALLPELFPLLPDLFLKAAHRAPQDPHFLRRSEEHTSELQSH
mgnify:CR=1 FL=1